MTIYKYCILIILLCTSLSSYANRGSFSKIEIEGLDKFNGERATVYYVSGRPAGFGTRGHKLFVNKIWNSKDSKIIENGSVKFSTAKIENKYGMAFNYILVVVFKENQKIHRIKNSDGSCPALPFIDFYKARSTYCERYEAPYKTIFQKYYPVRHFGDDIKEAKIRIKLH